MIPANELRINNLVYYNNQHNEIGLITEIISLITEIEYVGINSRIDVYYQTKNINPIPLTEEWLLKFGFDNKHNKDKFTIILKGKLNYEKGRTYFNSWTILEKQPDYVHELQNLYFALTGKELTLNK